MVLFFWGYVYMLVKGVLWHYPSPLLIAALVFRSGMTVLHCACVMLSRHLMR
jgi:hypothetical protein